MSKVEVVEGKSLARRGYKKISRLIVEGFADIPDGAYEFEPYVAHLRSVDNPAGCEQLMQVLLNMLYALRNTEKDNGNNILSSAFTDGFFLDMIPKDYLNGEKKNHIGNLARTGSEKTSVKIELDGEYLAGLDFTSSSEDECNIDRFPGISGSIDSLNKNLIGDSFGNFVTLNSDFYWWSSKFSKKLAEERGALSLVEKLEAAARFKSEIKLASQGEMLLLTLSKLLCSSQFDNVGYAFFKYPDIGMTEDMLEVFAECVNFIVSKDIQVFVMMDKWKYD